MRTISDEDDRNAGVSLGQASAIRETDMALLVELADGSEQWIPKSVIDDDSEVFGCREDEDEGQLVIKRWWAEAKGLL
jgi:hypothetical protein